MIEMIFNTGRNPMRFVVRAGTIYDEHTNDFISEEAFYSLLEGMQSKVGLQITCYNRSVPNRIEAEYCMRLHDLLFTMNKQRLASIPMEPEGRLWYTLGYCDKWNTVNR